MHFRFLIIVSCLLLICIPCLALADTVPDGNSKGGALWPDSRFTDNGDDTMTDRITGLVWPQEGGAVSVGSCRGGTKSWDGAREYVRCLNDQGYLGYADWRLPTVKELKSLINPGEANSAQRLNGLGFRTVRSSEYWSSTSYDSVKGYAWVVGLWVGGTDCSNMEYHYQAWPVRGGAMIRGVK